MKGMVANMKKRTLILSVALTLTLTLTACSKSDIAQNETRTPSTYVATTPAFTAPIMEASYDYLTFEEALEELATNVVIARYVRHRPFGKDRTLVEYEFAVKERILGDTANKIYVYTNAPGTVNAGVATSDRIVRFNPGDLSFDTDVDYLLALNKINSPLTDTHNDGFTFILDLVINLDVPENSTMYSEALTLHSNEFDFSENPSEEAIIAYVEEVIKDNTPARAHLNSASTKDIITGSPNVFVIEVYELLSAPRTDWGATDNYFVSLLQVLKGDVPSEPEVILTFPAHMAQPGNAYIVAVEPLTEGYDDWFQLTTKNSLFDIAQINEILEFINEGNDD